MSKSGSSQLSRHRRHQKQSPRDGSLWHRAPGGDQAADQNSPEEQLRSANGPLGVIHGIGTGKLKRGLRDWLTTVPYVERVVDAEKGDGGPGCSVIWVK